MTHDDYDTRFAGLQRLYGTAAYAQLKTLHLCVVGLGGVGSWAAEALARTGIGHLTLIDYDTVSLGNINRQLPALSETVGEKKHAVLARRIAGINPHCTCHCIDDFITADNLDIHLHRDRGYDFVIDAIDSITFKAAIVYYCKRNKIPVITTGGAGGCTDPTQIKVADLSRTYNDALAARVRGRLRDDYGWTKNPKRRFGVECVFSAQHKLYPKADGSVSHEKPGIHGVHLDCRFGYGSTSFVTASFGMLAAARAIDKALQRKLAR